MNGFREDVISILRDNMLLHTEAMGWVMGSLVSEDAKELLKDLEDRKFPVTGRGEKMVLLYDYVVIPEDVASTLTLLDALSQLSVLGVVILDISRQPKPYAREYKSHFGKFTARKVTYGDRAYMVIHSGVDYGN